MSDNVIEFPSDENEFLSGPYSYNMVVVDGRVVPKLTGLKREDGRYTLSYDARFSADFSSLEDAFQAAVLISHAAAISAGYSHFGADSKDKPYAPKLMKVSDLTEQPK